MVEYGAGVGQAAGTAGTLGGNQSHDVGAGIANFVSGAVHTVQTMPPEQLLLLVVGIIIGLVILRRAF